MIERNRGHIVSIDSIMGQEATCRAITYSSTKFGVRGLMDGLYDLIRLDNLKLNVTTIFPPLTNTRKVFYIFPDLFIVEKLHLELHFFALLRNLLTHLFRTVA